MTRTLGKRRTAERVGTRGNRAVGNGGSQVHRKGNGARGNTGNPYGDINQSVPVDRPVAGVMGGSEVGPP